MSKVNHVQLIGHVGKNPELKVMQDQTAVISFTLATNESYKDGKGEKITKTEWHNIVGFGSIASLVNNHVKSGSHVMVQGKLKTRQYTTKENVNKYVTEIVMEDILFLGNPPVKEPTN